MRFCCVPIDSVTDTRFFVNHTDYTAICYRYQHYFKSVSSICLPGYKRPLLPFSRGRLFYFPASIQSSHYSNLWEKIRLLEKYCVVHWENWASSCTGGFTGSWDHLWGIHLMLSREEEPSCISSAAFCPAALKCFACRDSLCQLFLLKIKDPDYGKYSCCKPYLFCSCLFVLFKAILTALGSLCFYK